MIEIAAIVSQGRGWGPIHHLVGLAGQLLEAPVQRVTDPGGLSTTTRLKGMAPRLRRRGTHLVVIASRPSQLGLLPELTGAYTGYDSVVGWVIDSFWTDEIPRITKSSLSPYDRLFITDLELLDQWRSVTKVAVETLPWGADVLGARPTATRIDLQRIGRQPGAWDDDTTNDGHAGRCGLRYGGRPAFGNSAQDEYRSVHRALAQARAVLAFSNRAAPGTYTHPTRDYLTGRWTDALAHGCMVAGQTPRSQAAVNLIPAESVIDVPVDDVTAGMELIADHLRAAPADIGLRIRQAAARTLDWRHRIRVLADALDVHTATLTQALSDLERIA